MKDLSSFPNTNGVDVRRGPHDKSHGACMELAAAVIKDLMYGTCRALHLKKHGDLHDGREKSTIIYVYVYVQFSFSEYSE